MKVKSEVKSLSRVRLLATPWTAAYQAPPSMGFSRQEYWHGLLLPLENPRDGGAWWAAIYGVAQSRTRLKRLSNSSSSFTLQLKIYLLNQDFLPGVSALFWT